MKNVVNIFVLIFVFTSCFYIADAKGKYPIEFKHWTIGCDNNNTCYAIGSPSTQEDFDYNNSWYIYIAWNTETKEIIQSHLKTGTKKIIKEFYGLNKEKKYINLFDYIDTENSRIDDYVYVLSLNKNFFKDVSNIYIKFDDEKFPTSTLNFAEFKNFYDNHVSDKVENFRVIIAYPRENFNYLTPAQVQTLQKKYNIDEFCERRTGFYFEIHGMKITALCTDDGYNPTYKLIYDKAKLNGNPLVSKTLLSLEQELGFGTDFINNDEAYGFGVAYNDDYLFVVGGKGTSSGQCGRSLKLVYDGKQFQLVKALSMPVCIGVDPADWPVIYSVPYQKK